MVEFAEEKMGYKMYVSACAFAFLRMYILMPVTFIYVCMHLCICVSVHVCMHVYISLLPYICIHKRSFTYMDTP